MLQAHIINVGLKSFLSFLPFIAFAVFSHSGRSEFNDFSYFFSIFNIFYGFVGLPIYQFILVNSNNGIFTTFFDLNNRLNISYRLFLLLFAFIFAFFGISEVCIAIISIIYSIQIASCACFSRKDNFYYEILSNISFFLSLSVLINIISYSSIIPFLISSALSVAISIRAFNLKNSISKYLKLDSIELKMIFPYFIISALGSLIAYGDMILAVKLLNANEAYKYIWLNRAILGSTILCIAFSNLLMSDKNNLLDRNRRIKLTLTSIFTALVMFLIAIFVLRVILDSDFTEKIFYILLIIVILKYLTIFPSITLVHKGLQNLRIYSTIVASFFYALTIIINMAIFDFNLWSLINAVLVYHLSIYLFNTFFSYKKKLNH